MTTPPQPNPPDNTVNKVAKGTLTVIGVLVGLCCVLPVLFVACTATLDNLGK